MDEKIRMDSCRKCGNDMNVKQRCSICTKPIKFTCKNCHYETDEQIHSICSAVNVNYRRPVYEVA